MLMRRLWLGCVGSLVRIQLLSCCIVRFGGGWGWPVVVCGVGVCCDVGVVCCWCAGVGECVDGWAGVVGGIVAETAMASLISSS
jgi:hypothetical protein